MSYMKISVLSVWNVA